MRVAEDAALEVRRGDHQRAVTSLREAVALQDGFQYMEPEHFFLINFISSSKFVSF